MQQGDYSTDMMKKMAFTHEVNNYLKIKIQQLQEEDPLGNIREISKLESALAYFEDRIKKFDKRNP